MSPYEADHWCSVTVGISMDAIRRGAIPSIENFRYAAMVSDVAMLNEIFQRRIDVKPLFIECFKYTVQNGSAAATKLFCEARKQYDAETIPIYRGHGDYDVTIHEALFWAADFRQDLDVIEVLLDQGASIHTHNDYVIRQATQRNNLQLVKLALQRGADVHVNKDAPLRSASADGFYEIVELLLAHGANKHACNGEALRMARRNASGHLRVVEMLEGRVCVGGAAITHGNA